MEYLMTYGWAILIVAVVLAALFQLGVFGGAFAPRAQPGTCKVIRPQGPDTYAYAGLQGVCTSMLPQFVAQFDGTGSNINLGTPNILEGLQVPVTISGWFKASSTTGSQAIYAAYDLDVHGSLWSLVRLDGGRLRYFSSSATNIYQDLDAGFIPSLNAWHHFTVVVEGSISSPVVTVYMDNLSHTFTTSAFASSVNTVTICIGGDGPTCSSELFKGSLANIQVYNTSLSSNEVRALYDEGIGGVPIQVANLAGWWQLNGNTNDTSGNLHNGIPTNIRYTSGWTKGYSLG